MDRYISRFGCPSVIHLDNGKEFVNKILEKLLAKLEVAYTTTPSYNPQSNNVERFHRTLREHYRMWTARRSLDWAKQLACLELAYNSKVNEATGLTKGRMKWTRGLNLRGQDRLTSHQKDP